MEKIQKKTCRECLSLWSNFRTLSEDEKKMIESNRFEALFKAGEVMIKQGSPAASMLFLAEGMAKTYIEGTGKKNILLNIRLPHSVILSPATGSDYRNSFSVSALTAVRACFIGSNVIQSLIKKNPAFALGIHEEMCNQLIQVHNKLAGITGKKMTGRIAEALVFLSSEIFKSKEFDIILSRQELGEMTNMAKESVVRVLKSLEKSGIIKINYSKIKITNSAKLKELAENG